MDMLDSNHIQSKHEQPCELIASYGVVSHSHIHMLQFTLIHLHMYLNIYSLLSFNSHCRNPHRMCSAAMHTQNQIGMFNSLHAVMLRDSSVAIRNG